MAMEINGLHYGSYGAQGMAGNGAADGVKKKETEQARETAGNSRSKSTAEYASELAKLVPSVEFKIGSTFASTKRGKTLTVDPRLLEKMRNDPEKEKEMKELIRGVESAVNMLESVNKASGWTVVFKHCYIDENGKFWSVAYLRNDFMLNMSDKLREERRKNSENLIEKTKEKATEKKKELEESIEEKMALSKDGTIYLDDADFRTIMEAVQEDRADKTDAKEQAQIGAKLDIKI